MTKRRTLRITVLSGFSPLQAFILAAVRPEHELVRIFRPTIISARTREKAQARLFSNLPGRLVARANREYRDAVVTRVEREAVLGLGDVRANFPADLFQEVDRGELSSAVVLDQVAASRPDVVLVAGSPKLGAPYETIAPLGCYNIHFGCTLAYRGDHNIWRALVDCNFDQVGVSIHKLTQELDGGNLVGWARPAFNSRDREGKILEASARCGAALLSAFLERLSCGTQLLGKQVPVRETKFVRFKDRTMLRDTAWRVRRAFQSGKHIAAEQHLY